ncbi:MAG: OFA family MFS transporter [Nitrospirae bacterium]|nr:OFA family MFS transporter [Nitrospirota bacterium]MBF0592379.1 OFA family MFS transporter [Nitrospirota bacterium]
MADEIRNKGWMVAFSGTCINLALGILYTWSIFKVSIKHSIESKAVGGFNWSLDTLNDPYSVCCLVFAFSMILAGRCQDKFGPKVTALIGGILVGMGFVWISQTTSYVSWVAGFGVLAGIGIGFGYSAATPPALKWFPPSMTGLIAGIVVSGFGLASVYIAPLSTHLISTWGLQRTMMFFGISFFIVLTIFSRLLINPPKDYVAAEIRTKGKRNPAGAPLVYASTGEMLKTPAFWILWTIYFIGAGAGLMVIGSVAAMAKKSMGEAAFVAVAIMAVGNAGGRVIAGTLSDKIGRSYTLAIMHFFQALLMFTAIPLVKADTTGAVPIVIIATLIGFNYGTNLSLFPSYIRDQWGLRNFGMNYGLLFTAWGVGGAVLSRVSQMLSAGSGSFTSSFTMAGLLLIVSGSMSFLIRVVKPVRPQPGRLV